MTVKGVGALIIEQPGICRKPVRMQSCRFGGNVGGARQYVYLPPAGSLTLLDSHACDDVSIVLHDSAD
jgi:hypothetical protein